AENQLDRLRRLNHADQAGQDSKHSAFGTRRHRARRGRLGIKAAVAGTPSCGEDACLTFEAKDRSIYVCLAVQHASVVDQVSGRKVVGSVDDDVKVTNDVECISARQAALEAAYVDARVDRRDPLGRGVQFFAPYVRSAMDHLPLEVSYVNNIEV